MLVHQRLIQIAGLKAGDILFGTTEAHTGRRGDAHGLHRFSDVDVPWRRHVHDHGSHLATHSLATCALNVQQQQQEEEEEQEQQEQEQEQEQQEQEQEQEQQQQQQHQHQHQHHHDAVYYNIQ